VVPPNRVLVYRHHWRGATITTITTKTTKTAAAGEHRIERMV
jgi:hypothetical protein